jgi:hypothetical protein
VRKALAGALALGVLVWAAVAWGAATFTDAAGDDNAAPDVTSVSVSEAADGMLTVSLTAPNYQTLPGNSWFNLWFDLDSNQQTGDVGDEALVRYLADGSIEFFLWNGSELVGRPVAGMTGRFEAGVLTFTAPESLFGGLSAFGILAVGARGQTLGDSEFVASDYAPDRGRSAFVGPVLTSFPDPSADQDAAPDITSVRVTDAKDGWISFAISTPNYATLPPESVLLVAIDRDNQASTGDNGADALITTVAGEIRLERWDRQEEEWIADLLPTRARIRNSGNVVTVDIHRSELENTSRFGFAVTAADVNVVADSVVGIDFAPDNGSFWRYTLTNKAAVRLLAARAVGAPKAPRAGKPFTITLPVRRSDTNRGITRGTVTCNVTTDGARVRATGRVGGGSARCSLVVPKGASVIRGSMTVVSGGAAVSSRFSFRVLR